MRKTTSYSSTFSDALSVDTAGLQKMLNSGRQTATQIGMAAGAKFCVGRRVYWNVAKIRKYGVYWERSPRMEITVYPGI